MHLLTVIAVESVLPSNTLPLNVSKTSWTFGFALGTKISDIDISQLESIYLAENTPLSTDNR
ncbi:hypothetical protein SDC9_123534 [bioreactor metagenome]|uniref:Uncharacterized protein n=1 Tax=bioreactor metagenome TaxID=1076179 RepID=A0A645CHX3_9ZZZZ